MNFLIQLTYILPPDELTKISASIIKYLEQKTDRNTELSDIAMEIYKGSQREELKALKHKMGLLKGKMREYKRSIAGIIQYAGSLANLNASSTATTDLQRLKRKEAVGKNVASFNDMTREDLIKKIADVENFMIGRIDIQYIKGISTISNSAHMLRFIKESLDSNTEMISLLKRCSELGGETVSLLIEHGDHPLIGDKSIAISESHTRSGVSAMPIPVIVLFIDMKIPLQDWLAMANDPEIAFWRLTFRNMIRSGKSTREFEISAASGELTLWLVYTFLSFAIAISNDISSETVGFNDTTTIFIRNLICFAITTASSGTNPKTEIFTLFSQNIKLLKEDESWIVCMLAKVLRFSGWNIDLIKFRLGSYFVKLLRKVLTDPLTDKLRKDVKSVAIKEQNKSFRNVQHELYFASIVCRIIFLFKDDETIRSKAIEISTRILEFKPSHKIPNGSVKEFIQFFNHIINKDIQPDFWEEKYFKHIVSVACDVFTKRSAVFAGPKQDVIDKKGCDKDFIKDLQKPYAHYKEDGEVHIQNSKSFENIDIGGIKGDAELKRISFCLQGQTLPLEELEERIKYIIGSEEDITSTSLDTVSIAAAEDLQVVEVKVHPLIILFEDHPDKSNSAKVLEFVRSIFSNRLSIDEIIHIIFESIKISKEYQNLILVLIKEADIDADNIYKIIELLLVNWRDNVSGESKAIEILR